MGKKDDKSSLYSCGGKGAVGLELKASGLQGECSTHGLATSLNWKKEIKTGRGKEIWRELWIV